MIRTLCEGVALNSTAELLPPGEGDTADTPRKALGSQTEDALLAFATACNELKYAQTRTFDASCPSVATASACLWLFQFKTTRPGDTVPLTNERRQWLQKNVLAAYAKRGYRTPCLAYRDSKMTGESVDSTTPESLEQQLVRLAFVAIADPLRPETREAVASCQKAGIVVRMVTGDSALTARSIACECGILSARRRMRGTPSWMGRTSERSCWIHMENYDRESSTSSIVLMDDDLAGVVSAVVSGRGVFDGISQFQITVIAVALSEACVGAVTLRQSHIAAVQIMWVILFMDVFASLVLMTDDSSDKF
ncbi:hypothetical protein PI126_g14410 [Phytophthora idaei]|nr:hypothetical protein PI126_g14410 [Phytophthora idaei]